jgi:hypothetical protein
MQQYEVKILNKFPVLENLDDNMDINKTQENIKTKYKLIAKCFSINYVFSKKIQSCKTEGSRLNYNICTIKTKQMKIIQSM